MRKSLLTLINSILKGHGMKVRRVRRKIPRKKRGVISITKKKEYEDHKEKAREIAHELIHKYVEVYNDLGIEIVPKGRVAIKNTVSRWGSCSNKGNLNFSYKLGMIPLPLAEYIVVHELCHLKEFNHSQKFWDLVALTVPDHEMKKEELRKFSLRK